MENIATLRDGKNKKNPTLSAQPQNDKMKMDSRRIYNNEYFAGSCLKLAEIKKQIDLVAPTNFSVIISGPSGSGKEAVARQIHMGSKRAHKPFVAIDCGALSKELSASELFGHEKGAFTGAIGQKTGSLEMADTGTIFLDEIGNLPYEIQVSLLRVVQERKIRRIGGNKDIDVDVRMIIASNINLWDAACAGKFREDLYHRFNEFSIVVPPLHERKQDILLFAHHFLKLTNAELGKNVNSFSKEVEYMLNNYMWHGNIRELRNAVRRATLLTTGNIIETNSLPFEILKYFKQKFEAPIVVKPVRQNTNTRISYTLSPEKRNVCSEYEITDQPLHQINHNKSKIYRSKDVPAL